MPFAPLLLRLLGSSSAQENLALENLALRQQLAVLKRSTPRPRLGATDRAFWVLLSRIWPGWKTCLLLVRPETVLRWHREGFRLFWRWRSRRDGAAGRPSLGAKMRALMHRLANENPTWGAPRIHGELQKLGVSLAQSTVSRYLRRIRRGPSDQTWRTFLRNHVGCAAGMDFFTVPTATFEVLYGFVIIDHGRRFIHHLAVTAHPTAEWVKRQLLEAFPFASGPRFLHRDRDSIFSPLVREIIASLGSTDVPSAPRSPWQNPFAERLIGTLRRECLDHLIVLGEAHARIVLREFQAYYNGHRTHLSLAKDSPIHRPVEDSSDDVVATPILGGLHHVYSRPPPLRM